MLSGARGAELERLLETAAYVACTRFGAQSLSIERDGADVTHINLVFEDATSADLWELDPIIWDDAHWAASRYLEPGEQRTIAPMLHKD